MAYSHLECPYCEVVKTTSRALYWHLKVDHNVSHDNAFIAVADSLARCSEKHGSDRDLDRNDRDFFNNRDAWKKHYTKRDTKYFDRGGR